MRSAFTYGVVGLLGVATGVWVLDRLPGPQGESAARLAIAAVVFVNAWLLSFAGWMRCGLCGTRFTQNIWEYVIPLPACRSCGVSPGARTTTPDTINRLLYDRFGLWGEANAQVDPELRNVTVQDKRRRVPYLRRLRGDLDRSLLSRYDRERLIARIDRELAAVDGGDVVLSERVERGAV